MIARGLFLAFALIGAIAPAAVAVEPAAAPIPAAASFDGASPLTWSRRLADSEMARLGDSLEAGQDHARWDYSPAVLDLALWRLADATGDEQYRAFATRAIASFVRPDGSIEGFSLADHTLDAINPGKVVLLLADRTHEERFRQSARTLRDALAAQPRTSEGGFWHKQRYPHQLWLDGLYMASPFLAQYAAQYHEPALFDDVAKQILLMDRHLYDPKTGLYWHGWDESRAQSWADPQTGHSPNFWSRAIGWYAMGIVDVLDWLPANHPARPAILGVLRHAADGIVRWQDPSTGLWWQITNAGARKGNYLEGSGSSMFVYALAKAINRGYLPSQPYRDTAVKGFAGLIGHLIKTGPDGRVSLTQICQGAGLGYTTASGRARDGSYDYYLSEPVVANDPKGTGPFIMAGIQLQALLSAHPDTPAATSPADEGWAAVPAILARIQAPTFPARDFPITAYGARSGQPVGAALHAAIEACAAAGGGRVVVPAGDWLTGAVRLRSHVELHLEPGATLRFSTDPADYPVVFTRWEGIECYNYAPFIYAFGEEDVAVTGTGTLDGQASDANWWAWKGHRNDAKALNAMGEEGVPVEKRVFGPGHFLRPNFIEMYRCRNVLIADVTIVRSPMWEIHPVLSQNVTVRRVRIHSHGPNNDGCDPESSRDVLIEGCVFDTGDDCIAIKSGRNNDGRRVNVPSESIVIRHCAMQDGHGGVVIGSEVSGGCRDVFAEDCTMDSPNLDRVLRLKSNARRGGTIENVFLRRIRVGQVTEAVLTVDLQYEEGANGPFPPTIRRIELDDVTAEHTPRLLWIAGFPGAVVDDIRFRHCTFRGVTQAERVSGAKRIVLDDVTIEPAMRHASLNSRPAR